MNRPRPPVPTTGLPALGTVAAAVLALGACGSGPERRAYVERLGRDTMALEAFTRHENLLEGEIVSRSPNTRVGRYSATLAEDGSVAAFEIEWSAPGADPDADGDGATQAAVVTIGADSATIIRTREGETDTVRVASGGTPIPTTGRVPLAVGLFEQAVRATGVLEREDAEAGFTLLWPLRGRSQEMTARRRGEREAAIEFFGAPVIATFDGEGRVVSISGRETTVKVEIERLETAPDLTALASEFAARDARGEGLGIPSPPATVTETGGGATFEVAYSRPAMRGRSIWGGLVPYGEVWRTGANAATHFTADRDLRVGEVELPAGTYTLWTTFTPDSATLILNSQTDIWGTAHDPEHDFATVPMRREELAEPVERFTISMEPTEWGAILHMAWDRTRFSVPLRVREDPPPSDDR